MLTPKAQNTFITKFGNRYTDPVSTYFAEAAYEKAHNGKSVMMSDEIIDKYENLKQHDGEKSELGFYMFHLPVDTKIDNKVSLDIYNNYIFKNLDIYMNLIAKNPSSEARDAIDKQFHLKRLRVE
jgi:hypothetical protein